MLASPRQLKMEGVLGMNKRNGYYIGHYNPRYLFPRVDDKLKSKRLAEEAGIAVPKLLGVLHSQYEVAHAKGQLDALSDFVVKPSKGSGGKGILVICGKNGDDFVKPSGELVSIEDIIRHLSNTLSGLYSLGGQPDVAMIEGLVEFDPAFEKYSYEGVPDIRVICFLGYPVMAMLRLATHASDGKANLHQGAIGVGLNLANGKALFAVEHNRPVLEHPDTGVGFDRLSIPHWRELLILAARCCEITGLGYLGADIVLDRSLGPLILELNARPGLAIQMANGQGLLPRLHMVEELSHKQLPVEERVAFSMEHFGKDTPPG